MARGKVVPRRPMFQQITKMLKSDEYAKPRWYEAMKRFPPPSEPMKASKPPGLRMPETDLLENNFKKLGVEGVDIQPIHAANSKYHLVKAFTMTEYELRQQGVPKKKAYEMAMAKHIPEAVGTRHPFLAGFKYDQEWLDRVLEEEEPHVEKALAFVRQAAAQDRDLAKKGVVTQARAKAVVGHQFIDLDKLRKAEDGEHALGTATAKGLDDDDDWGEELDEEGESIKTLSSTHPNPVINAAETAGVDIYDGIAHLPGVQAMQKKIEREANDKGNMDLPAPALAPLGRPQGRASALFADPASSKSHVLKGVLPQSGSALGPIAASLKDVSDLAERVGGRAPGGAAALAGDLPTWKPLSEVSSKRVRAVSKPSFCSISGERREPVDLPGMARAAAGEHPVLQAALRDLQLVRDLAHHELEVDVLPTPEAAAADAARDFEAAFSPEERELVEEHRAYVAEIEGDEEIDDVDKALETTMADLEYWEALGIDGEMEEESDDDDDDYDDDEYEDEEDEYESGDEEDEDESGDEERAGEGESEGEGESDAEEDEHDYDSDDLEVLDALFESDDDEAEEGEVDQEDDVALHGTSSGGSLWHEALGPPGGAPGQLPRAVQRSKFSKQEEYLRKLGVPLEDGKGNESEHELCSAEQLSRSQQPFQEAYQEWVKRHPGNDVGREQLLSTLDALAKIDKEGHFGFAEAAEQTRKFGGS